MNTRNKLYVGLLAVLGGAELTALDEVKSLLKEKASEFKTARDGIEELGKELKAKMERGESNLDGIKSQVDSVLTNYNELKSTVTTLEQKIAEGVRDLEGNEAKGYGEQIIESTQFKQFSERGLQGSFRLEAKIVNSVAAGGGLIRSRRENDLVALRQERFVVRDLLPVVPVSETSIEYATQTSRTNNVATYAEGAPRAYSDYVWGMATASIRNLGHLAKVTRQALADAPRLAAEVNAEMRYGLGLAEEQQLLFGNGTGTNINGIMPQATAYALPAGAVLPSNKNRADVLRMAILQAALGIAPADGIVLNPVDWTMIEMLKDADGNYLFGGPQAAGVAKRMWGLPVVDSTAMTQDNFLVGNFSLGATLYQREGVEMLVSTENADDFEKRLATLSCDERIGLGVKRPGAFYKGTFGAALL